MQWADTLHHAVVLPPTTLPDTMVVSTESLWLLIPLAVIGAGTLAKDLGRFMAYLSERRR